MATTYYPLAVAKDFLMMQSSRRGYHPYGRSDWIEAIKKIFKQGEVCLPAICKTNTHTSTTKALGFSVIGTKLCMQQDLLQKGCGYGGSGTRKKSSTN